MADMKKTDKQEEMKTQDMRLTGKVWHEIVGREDDGHDSL